MYFSFQFLNEYFVLQEEMLLHLPLNSRAAPPESMKRFEKC